MNYKILNVYKMVFVIVSLVTFSAIFVSVKNIQLDKLEMNVFNGNVFIGNKELDKELELTGTYRYYEDLILTPSNIDDYLDKASYIKMSDRGAFLDGNVATVSFTVYNYSNRKLTLKFPDFVNSYKIFIDGVFYDGELNDYTDYNSNYRNEEIYINIGENKKTEILVQLKRDKNFLFGFMSPPVIGTHSYISNKLVLSKMAIFSTILILFIFSIFLFILSYISKNRKKTNIDILIFLSIGIVIYSKMILSWLLSNSIVNLPYISYLKYENIFYVLVGYLICAYCYFCCERNSKSKFLFNILTYVTVTYSVIILFSGVLMGEYIYKSMLYGVIVFQICAYYLSYINNKNYYINSIYSFAITVIFNIAFIFTIPQIYLFKQNFLFIFGYFVCILILICKTLFDIFVSKSRYDYILDEKILSLQIQNREKQKVQKILNIERNTKEHALQLALERTKTDLLTGLFNRAYIIEKIEEKISELDGTTNEFSIILFDIDNFKFINEAYGRNVSDELIIRISECLPAFIKKYDYIARWEGGSFMLVLTDTHLSTAVYIAERIRQTISEMQIVKNDNATVSAGVVRVRANSKFEDLDVRLNVCISKAKRVGKNCVFFDENYGEYSRNPVSLLEPEKK